MHRSLLRQLVPLMIVIIVTSSCTSDDKKKTTHFQKGVEYYNSQQYRQAEIELKNAIQIDPKYMEANTKLADTYLRLGNSKAAYRQYSTILKIDPENTIALLNLAKFNMLAKKFDVSRSQVDKILENEPENLDELYLKAGLLDLEKEFEGSGEIYLKIIGIDDAGRGPVLGSMILAGVLIPDESHNKIIKELGAKDSKLLIPSTRKKIKEKIISTYLHHLEITNPKEIDDSDNLNYTEAIKAATCSCLT